MSYRKFADEGENSMDNPNIYNEEEDNRLLSGQSEVCCKYVFDSGPFRDCILLCWKLFILLSSTKQTI